jgi:NADH-ubiquinone oxidoreductase chain 5
LGRLSYLYTRSRALGFSRRLIIILIMAASTKSAQLPFSSWLPAAIAAPTPVSSLVHSSTLVTAGVYLLIRINYILRRLARLWALIMLGAGTILIAGIRAMGERDIKKIIALSTLSQLGLMFMTLGIGLPILTFFHLCAHAYFKAIIFICAGGVIHRINDYQDTRILGASAGILPMSLRIFLVGNLRLCGLPFMAGFYSKDLILELIIIRSTNIILFIVAIVATFFTVAYSLRVIKMIFFSMGRIDPGVNIQERDMDLIIGILILLFPAIIGGLAISWVLGTHIYVIFLPDWLKLIVLIIILMAVTLRREQAISKFGAGGAFFHNMWFIPFIFRGRSTAKVLKLRKIVNKLGENGWNSSFGYKILSRVNSLGGNYFSISITRRALKRVWFILAARVLII